ncbi:hypothetical protein ACGF5O_10015 [Streptomyces sp. NPDC048291]|uniref:hypothetical protein n=1 Tax=Streptomyces sp. NPDC048291 TaxID=3365530 RepID=UPI003715B069
MVSPAGSGPDGPLLVLDYPGERPEARVSELDLPGPRDLLTVPPPPLPPGRYLAALSAGRPPGPAGAVLAYCASAPLAAVLAAGAGRGDRAAPLVLFEAEPVTAATVLTAYAATLAQLGVRPDPREVRHLAARVPDPGAFLTAARARLSDHVGAALRADGAATGEVDDLASAVTDSALRWLAHLLAAHHAPPPDRTGPTLRILSAHTPGDGLRVMCDRTDLLRDPRTAEAVVSFLTAHGALTGQERTPA